MPIDLEHLHLTGMSGFQDAVGWIDAIYNVYLPGSCGVLLSEASVDICIQKAQEDQKSSPSQPRLDAFVRRNG